MKIRFRTILLLFAAVMSAAATASLLCAQGRQSQPSPATPSDIVGPQLIAWSQMQKPQPVPQPLPPPDKVAQQPDETAKANPQQEPTAAQTYTGTIEKNGEKYVLKVSDSSTYQLDDQNKAKQYEGQHVKVSGALDASGDLLHVTQIELIS